MRSLLVVLALVVAAQAYHEKFDAGWEGRWVHSADEKYSGKFAVETPKGLSEPALKVTEKAKHYGMSVSLPEPVDPSTGPLVLQYDLKFTEPHTCAGAYLKFLTQDDAFTPTGLKDDTPYAVMFGPDKCGSTNKVRLGGGCPTSPLLLRLAAPPLPPLPPFRPSAAAGTAGSAHLPCLAHVCSVLIPPLLTVSSVQ